MKKSLLLAAAVAASLTSGVATADVSANATAASNYVWRGISQTANQAAIQGGLDWSGKSGLYVGTWVSNVDFTPVGQAGYEMDLYAGFAGEAGSVGYDVGVITYQYPLEANINFTEVYVAGSVGILSVGANLTVDATDGNKNAAFDEGDLYLSASVDYPVGKVDVSVYAGTYIFDADGFVTTASPAGQELDYSHFGASISKDGFTFAVDKNDVDSNNAAFGAAGKANDVRFTVSYSVDFEL